MKFATEIDADLTPYQPDLQVHFEIDQENAGVLSQSGLCAVNLNLEFAFQGQNNPDALLLETLSSLYGGT